MESFKIFRDAIKALNEKILFCNYTCGKESPQTRFLEETKGRFLDMYLLDKDVYYGITSSSKDNGSFNFNLITHDLTYDDEGKLVFIYMDLNNGNICLGDDGGFPNLRKAVIDEENVESDFRIEKILNLEELFNIFDIPKISINSTSDYFKLLAYLKNNPVKILPTMSDIVAKR